MKRFNETNYLIENHTYSVEEISRDEITLLNWNIQKKNNFSNWRNEFKTLLDKYNPSIILLQECQFKKGLESLLFSEHYGFIFAPNFIDLFKNLHSGVLTASHGKHSFSEVTKSHAFEPFIKVPKIFLSTKYRISQCDQELLVINIHAINFVGFWKFISQVQQLEYNIKSHNGPVILSGDFNTWNKKRSKILDKIITGIGLEKVRFNNSYSKNIKKFLFFNTLDHIYFKGLDIDQNPKALKTTNSDHNPLFVRFKLTP
ncbi:endonuclease/exonuclease/phosphatase family protein [Thiospirochaeta perfilievii]|uniref:Endonuclease/exonuclease/phosphatase family protein n=1 Tax=Thiospirochaeta perfilievii TaxID=252967 RepID=A0A5C1QDZ7_9SPIO|nr:endonuclease/exonuclease/phosphatase family protein [Thiospirochaeta perfilievii]QEN06295.1 endonuclease/exonuclease/phosphatase family protein [Thiospirochaeta perfilievii]